MDIENGNEKKCFAMVVDKKQTKNDFRRWKAKLSFFFYSIIQWPKRELPKYLHSIAHMNE